MLPWIKVKALRYESQPCQNPSKSDELCWTTRWSRLTKAPYLEEDFDGAPFEKAAPFDSAPASYFRVKAAGNEKTFKIVDEDDNIIWS